MKDITDEIYEEHNTFFSKEELETLFIAWVKGRQPKEFDETETELFNRYLARMNLFRLNESILYVILHGHALPTGFDENDELDIFMIDPFYDKV